MQIAFHSVYEAISEQQILRSNNREIQMIKKSNEQIK